MTENKVVTHSFEIARPDIVKEIEVGKFVGAAAGLTVGLISGGLLGSIFGSSNTDHTEEINQLNNNIHKVDKKIRLTNARIDILSTNMTNSMTKIRLILDNLAQVQKEVERRSLLMWHLDHIQVAAVNSLLLIKIAENQLTLLRNGKISSDLLNIPSIRAVIDEGLKYSDISYFTN